MKELRIEKLVISESRTGRNDWGNSNWEGRRDGLREGQLLENRATTGGAIVGGRRRVQGG